MLAPDLLRRFDERRIRLLLGGFFLLLAVLAAVLIRQAYGQLQREAYYQHRLAAEEFTRAIDARLRERLAEVEAHSFADYSFLVLAGDPSANFVQRSPLAAFPVAAVLPGTMGYFQVDASGDFATPLLPPAGSEPAALGIDAVEYAGRAALAAHLHAVLADNRLVRGPAAAPPAADFVGDAEVAVQRRPAAPSSAGARYVQRNFDALAGTGEAAAAAAEEARAGEQTAAAKAGETRRLRAPDREQASSPARGRRIEQTALPEVPAAAPPADAGAPAAGALRVSTFESEVEPFQLGMLDSGHLVLFRNAWREGQRYVQGMLLERDAFVAAAIVERYRAAALAATSDLAVTWHGEPLAAAVADAAAEPGGTPLYRSRLSAPFGSLGLVYSARELPPGPGAAVLAWVTLLVAVTLAGGFVGLDRLATGQLRLARQQQDFVSAVSHELKTPLTAIRMYGELLREGWAPEEKRKQYYEYIHDESERLARLISNVLHLASITRGEPRLSLQTLGVGELLDRVLPKLGEQARRADFELAVARDPRADEAALRIDEDGFLQVLINLLDNAIKFSASAPRRRVEFGSRLEATGDIVFSIRDYGPGVPAGQMRKIFELFYRAEDELTRSTVGTGIGLAIVHQLCTAMNGHADVLNRAPGAEFRVAFPVTT